MRDAYWKWAAAGALAGIANGFFGGGGGMLLVPLLLYWIKVEEKTAFASSVAIILPICLVSAFFYWQEGWLDLGRALPYLAGGFLGGIVGGRAFRGLSPRLLRVVFALFLIYGGVRCFLQ